MGLFSVCFSDLGERVFGYCFCINQGTDLLLSMFSSLTFFNLIPILYKITKYTEKAEFVTLVHTHTVNKIFLCMALQR